MFIIMTFKYKMADKHVQSTNLQLVTLKAWTKQHNIKHAVCITDQT